MNIESQTGIGIFCLSGICLKVIAPIHKIFLFSYAVINEKNFNNISLSLTH